MYITVVVIIYQSYMKGVINKLHTGIHHPIYLTPPYTPPEFSHPFRVDCRVYAIDVDWIVLCHVENCSSEGIKERYVDFGINNPNMSMHNRSWVTKQNVQRFLIHYNFQAASYWNKLTWQKKCQEKVLQFMFLYIIRPLRARVQIGRKTCGLYTVKDGRCFSIVICSGLD